MAKLVRQFGDTCHVRRPRDLADQPDNSVSITWEQVPGLHDGVAVVLGFLSEDQRRRIWGERIEATMTGTTAMAHGLVAGDVLRPVTGSFRHRAFQVTATRPNDYAEVVDLYLLEVPDERDYGF